MRSPTFLVAGAATAVLLAVGSHAQTSLTWDASQTAGAFNDPSRWIGGTAPADTDLATISGPVTVTFSAAVNPTDIFGRILVANTAALHIDGDLTVDDLDAESGGEIQVTGGSTEVSSDTTLTTGSTLTVEDGGSFTVDGSTTVTSESGVTVTGGSFDAGTGTQVSDDSSIEITGGSFTSSGNVTVEQSSSFNISGGSVTAEGEVIVSSDSTLTVTGGTAEFSNGTTVETGSAIQISSGSLSITGESGIAGELRFSADANATLGDTTIASPGTVIQTGGLVTAGTLDVYGTADLQSGQWHGTDLHIRSGANATWTGNQSTFSGDIYLGGTASLNGGSLSAATLALNDTGASLTQSAGTLAITGETRLNAHTSFAKSDGSFTAGSLVFTGSDASFVHSGGTSTISGPLSITQLSDATFTISGGTFRTTGNADIFGNGTSSGANDLLVSGNGFFDIDGDLTASGNTEIVTSGTSRFDVGVTLSAGLVNGENVRLTIGSGSTLNTGNAIIGGNGKGTVSLSGTHHVDGTLTVGSLASSSQSLYLVNSAGSLTADTLVIAPVSGSSARVDVGGLADIVGDVHVGAATDGGTGLLRITTGTLDAANLTVHAGSSLTQSGNLRLTGSFTNEGSTTFSGGSVDATTFTNTNTLTVNTGTASNLVTANFVNTGSAFLNASLTLDRTSGAHSNAGTILIESPATLSLYPSATFHNTGEISVAGSFGGISATILDEGTLQAGIGIGTGTILGDYTLLADGHITIELGGLIQGTQYDRLHFQGATPEFYGWLDVNLVNSFSPALGDTFDILTGTSPLSTAFRGINVTGLDSSLMLVGENLGTTYRLTVAEYVASGGSGSGGGLSPVPEPSTYAALFGLAVLGWAAHRRRTRPRPLC